MFEKMQQNKKHNQQQQEQVLWEGKSHWTSGFWASLIHVLVLGFIYFLFYHYLTDILSNFRISKKDFMFWRFVCGLSAFIVVMYRLLSVNQKYWFTDYTLTNERFLRVSLAFPSMRRDHHEWENHRVLDFDYYDSWLQRQIGTGNIIVYTTDETDKEVYLTNIKSSFDVKEIFRKNVKKARKKNKVNEQINNNRNK